MLWVLAVFRGVFHALPRPCIAPVTRSLINDGFQFGHRADDGEHRPAHGTFEVDLILCTLMKRTPKWSTLERSQQVALALRAKRSNFQTRTW